jgi:hypothetical protein
LLCLLANLLFFYSDQNHVTQCLNKKVVSTS